MAAGELISQTDVVTAIDYGQIYLYGWEIEEPGLGSHELASRRSSRRNGLAGDGWQMVVLSPHRNNFDAHFSVERWLLDLLDDLDQWEEAVEGAVMVEGDALVIDSPTIGGVRGADASRILRRPRLRAWLHRTRGHAHDEAGDVWRVQVWQPNPPRRLRS